MIHTLRSIRIRRDGNKRGYSRNIENVFRNNTIFVNCFKINHKYLQVMILSFEIKDCSKSIAKEMCDCARMIEI